jgi:hypothetical protein
MKRTKQKKDSDSAPFAIKIYPSLLEGIVEESDLCQPFCTFVKMKIKSYESLVQDSKQKAAAKFWDSKKGESIEFELRFVMNVPVGYHVQIYAFNGQPIMHDDIRPDRLDYDSYNQIIISKTKLPPNPNPQYKKDYEKIFLSCWHQQPQRYTKHQRN